MNVCETFITSLRNAAEPGILNVPSEYYNKVKIGNISLLINYPQLIVNLYKLAPTEVRDFLALFKTNMNHSFEVLQACSSYLGWAFMTPQNKVTKEFVTKVLNEKTLKGLRNLDNLDFFYNKEHVGPVYAADELRITEIDSELCPFIDYFSSTDCAFETKINALKFPKPTKLGTPTYSPTGRDLAVILQNIAQTMDNHPDKDREERYDQSIAKAVASQQTKYKARTIKASQQKKAFKNGAKFELNTIKFNTMDPSSYSSSSNEAFGFLSVEINSNSYEFLIDSGALVSFIHKDIIKPNKLEPCNVKISTAGNPSSSENVVGRADVKLKFWDNKKAAFELLHNFIVLKDCNNFAGIIGCDLLFSPEYSVGIKFDENLWEIKLNEERIMLPFHRQILSIPCVLAEKANLKPKETRVVKVHCMQVFTGFLDKHFICEGNPAKDCEIIPTLADITFDQNDHLQTHLMIINKQPYPITLTENTYIDCIKPQFEKGTMEIEIPEEPFLDAIQHRRLNPIISEYCQNKFDEAADLIGIDNLTEDITYLSNINFIYPANKVETQVKVIETSNNEIDCNQISSTTPSTAPNIQDFQEYSEMLDDCAKQIGKNVRFKTDDEICQGYKENLDQIKEKTPELVLPDDYINTVNETLTTNLGESDATPETYSYKDVDLSHIPAEVRPEYEHLMKKYQHIFAQHSWDIGHTNLMTVKLETTSKPVSQKQRHIPIQKLTFVNQAIAELNQAGIIKKSGSWTSCSNLILVPKYKNVRYSTKADTLRADASQIRAYRICVDLRNLNEVLAMKCCSMSNPPEKIIMPLANKLVTNLDVCQAYFSIPLHPDSQHLTSFFVDNNVYMFTRLSQGLLLSPRAYDTLNDLVYDDEILLQAAATAMNKLQRPCPLTWDEFVKKYQDDSWLFSEMNYWTHLFYLSMQFYAIARSGLKLSPTKCKIATTNVKVLGLEVDTLNANMAMDIQKSQSILYWPDPTSKYEVHSRLYSCLYYSKFLPKLKEITAPLQELLKEDAFVWTDRHKEAWENLKALIILDLRLYIPGADEQLYLFTDASKISCSSILFVEKNGSLRVVGADSTLFNYSDSLKSPFIKESISLVRGLKKFSTYIGASNKRLSVFTDCRSLLFMARKKEHDIASFNLSNALLFYQSSFGFDIYHIPGTANVYSDLCSRAYTQSRIITANKYNLSKEQSEILPPLTSPFLLDGDVLYEYLMGQPVQERWDIYDKSKRKISTPRPLTNLTKLFEQATPEEKHVSAVRFLKQWNDESLTKIDYTEQINKKIGITTNTMVTESCNENKVVVISCIGCTRQGEILSPNTIKIPAYSSYELTTDCNIKTNSRITLISDVKNLDMDLLPINSCKFKIQLTNLTNQELCCLEADRLGHFASNTTTITKLVSPVEFNTVRLNNYKLPVSGIEIVELPELNLELECINSQPAVSFLNKKGLSLNNNDISSFEKSYVGHILMENNKLTKEVLIELQAEDEFCKQQKELLPNKNFALVNDVLCKTTIEANHVIHNTVIPDALIHELIEMIHTTNGHPTVTMFHKIFKANYYHFNQKKLIEKKIHECLICARVHSRPATSIKKGDKRTFVPTGPRQSISMDIIPKLNVTDEDNSQILLIVDNYSRYGSAVMMTDKSESSVLNALKNYCLTMGPPMHVYSDSEASIIAAVHVLLKHFNFVFQSSPADCQFKNRAENCFKDLKGIITRVLYEPSNQLVSKNWDLALIYALNIYNTAPIYNSSLLTREYIQFNNKLKSIPLVYCDDPALTVSEVDEILKIHENKKLKQYAKINSKMSLPEFEVNDIIYARGAPAPGVKRTFDTNTRGPFQILTVDNTTKVVTAKMYNSNKIHTIGFERINKVPLKDIKLELFQNFLPSVTKRDFHMRPRGKSPEKPLYLEIEDRQKISDYEKPVTRSQTRRDT